MRGLTPKDRLLGDAWRLDSDEGADVTHRVGRHVDRKSRRRWPKCGTGQSDRAMSVLAHEPRRAALRTQHHGILHRAAACETCSAAVEAAML